MKIRYLLSIAVAAGMCGSVAAADSTAVPTSPVTIYAGGFGIGVDRAINKQLKDKHEQFLKLSFQNTITIRSYVAAFCDIDWFGPGDNLGADLGIDLISSRADIRPFIGVGVGVHHFGTSHAFSDNIGPSATVHVGLSLDLTDHVQMRLRVPYHVVFNKALDNMAGVEIGFLFSDKFRHVNKYLYDK